MIAERMTHKLRPGKSLQDLGNLEKKWDAFEKQLGGFPPKRRYWTYIGTQEPYLFIWEREWESLTAMEAAGQKYRADPESAKTMSKLISETIELVEFGPHELYRLWLEDR